MTRIIGLKLEMSGYLENLENKGSEEAEETGAYSAVTKIQKRCRRMAIRWSLMQDISSRETVIRSRLVRGRRRPRRRWLPDKRGVYRNTEYQLTLDVSLKLREELEERGIRS